jgi:hypothetical protein
VSIEVAAGSVVVLGGAWVGVSGEDLGVAEWDADVRVMVIAACRSEWGLTWRGCRRPSRSAGPCGTHRGSRWAFRSSAGARAVPR